MQLLAGTFCVGCISGLNPTKAGSYKFQKRSFEAFARGLIPVKGMTVCTLLRSGYEPALSQQSSYKFPEHVW